MEDIVLRFSGEILRILWVGDQSSQSTIPVSRASNSFWFTCIKSIQKYSTEKLKSRKIKCIPEKLRRLNLKTIIQESCVLSLGCRHSVESWNLTLKTREKVCVWCVFESHTHSDRVQKLSLWYCFRKWCPGAQPYFFKISFNYRYLEDVKDMKVVLKAVPMGGDNLPNSLTTSWMNSVPDIN